MSALALAFAVFAGLALQTALVAGLAIGRRGLLRHDRRAHVASRAGAWSGWRRFQVSRIADETPDGSIRSFFLRPLDGAALVPFQAGQYLTLQVPVPKRPEGEAAVRCYSLSAPFSPEHFRVSVKRVGPPAGSDVPAGIVSNYLHDEVRPGTELLVRAPAGHFVLAEASHKPVALIAAGVGITPVWSMLLALLEEQPRREVWFLFGARSGAEHPFRSELAALAAAHSQLHVCVAYSQPGPDDQRGRDFQVEGRVDIAMLQACLPDHQADFYICGPTPMMESLVPALREWDVPESAIHYEAFGPASLSRPTDNSVDDFSPLVTFASSGQTVAWSARDRCLLDLAERSGVRVDSGCRAGSCGSCQTPLEEGDVQYLQTPDFDVEAGHCLLCVSRPATDLVLGG